MESKTSWKKGQSGNPKGRPRKGESAIETLRAELSRCGQEKKLAKKIVKEALSKDADWRLTFKIYDFMLELYKIDMSQELEQRLTELEKMFEEIAKKKVIA